MAQKIYFKPVGLSSVPEIETRREQTLKSYSTHICTVALLMETAVTLDILES